MARLACVDVAELPLTLLLRKHPEWVGRPAALVDANTPQGVILAVNRQAREQRIRTGMRYAAGMAIHRDLVADTVAPGELAQAVAELATRLRAFAPDVEAAPGTPGIFLMNAEGLEWLYPDLETWAGAVRSELWGAGYGASIGVGSTRLGSLVLARERRAAGGGTAVVARLAEEQERVRAAPLAWLELEPRLRDELERLGVTQVGELLALPASGVMARFGPEAYRLHRQASLALDPPLDPERPEEPVRTRIDFEPAETDSQRLLFQIKRALPALLADLRARGQALRRLHLRLGYEGGGSRHEALAPAEPCMSEALLLDLLRLRLEALSIPPLDEIEVLASGVAAPVEQLELFREAPLRDLRAANRALARVRAELGAEAVVLAVPTEGHLPEATFRWELLEALGAANPQAVAVRPRVRRVLDRPAPLPGDLEEELPRRIAGGPLCDVEGEGRLTQGTRWQGPFEVSGGWWQGAVARRYHYAERSDGSLYWLYFDVARRRWRMQGRVE